MKKTIITYTNRKTGKEYTFEGTINEGTTVVLVDTEGDKHLYAASTVKKNYKKAEKEVEVEEPKAEEKPMTHHQEGALENIREAYNWVVGGLENSVQDGQLESMPPVEEMLSEVYAEATQSCHTMVGGMSVHGGNAPICMKFAGKAFIRKQIAKLFREDGYEVSEDLEKVPEKKAGRSNFVDGERVNLRNDEGERLVNVRAFTGMLIGTFRVEKETSTTITVKAAKGKLKFDKETGLQINANSPKFANRIEI